MAHAGKEGAIPRFTLPDRICKARTTANLSQTEAGPALGLHAKHSTATKLDE